MAKSSRSRVVKENNRRLKKNVFGPVESERVERLSAKLLALAAEPKAQNDVEMNEGRIPNISSTQLFLVYQIPVLTNFCRAYG